MAQLYPEFKEKVAVITGAASGMGLATATAFAANGAHVALIDLNGDNLTTAAEKCKAAAISQKQDFLILNGDLTNSEFVKKSVEATIEKFQKIDILVNSAGIYLPDDLEDFDLQVFDKIIAINLRALYHMSAVTAPHLKKTKGSIVNLSSITAEYLFPKTTSYSMTKAAVSHLTRLMASELGSYGVRVNALCPGLIRTPLSSGSDYTEDEIIEKTPLKRYGQPEEMADFILFVASDRNSFMTGSTLKSDGGISLKEIL